MMQATQAEFHRQLRSLFAVLRTLVRQTTAGRESIDEYAAHLEGRIGSLARAHEMLMRAPPEGVDLHEIVCSEMLAQAVPEERFRIRGPDIRIAREATAALALTVHELTENSLSHGALSTAEGRAEVAWETARAEGGDWLHLRWMEHEAALADVPREKTGFGTELIERMLPYELGARTNVEFHRDGVRVEIAIPAAGAATFWREGR